MRFGLAATTALAAMAGIGFVVANHARAMEHRSDATVAAHTSPDHKVLTAAAPPPTGTLTVGVSLRLPVGVSAFNGNVYMSNTSRNQVTEQKGLTGAPAVVAGLFTGYGEHGDGGQASAATLNQPTATVEDAAGNIYIADTNDNVVREVSAATGVITRVAGTGTAGSKASGDLAVNAELYLPQGLAVNAAGDLFIADTGNNRVVEVLPSGQMRVFAGTGKAGYAGDGGKATNAELNQPTGLAIDSQGNVYIADSANNVIRRVDATTGIITTVAGDYAADQVRTPVDDGVNVIFERGEGGFAGDGGPATEARLNDPQGIALDSAGDLFIADRLNNAIREVTPGGDIYTVVNQAGSDGAAPAAGGETSGPATASKLNGPTSVAVDDSTGTLWIADTSNSRITPVTGLVQTGSAAGPVAP